jgi:hypothetical protein
LYKATAFPSFPLFLGECSKEELSKMVRFTTVAGAVFALAVASTGCNEIETSTSLRPEGPPLISQVIVMERVQAGAVIRTVPSLAFGDHPDIATVEENPTAGDDRVVTAAAAISPQRIRVVVDELLKGHALEKIVCEVPDGETENFISSIPEGTTPDDVEACSKARAGEAMPNCPSICVDPVLGKVGILDINGDGAPDEMRFNTDVVSLSCGGVTIPLDVEKSFYQPSGNQLITAGPDGVESLGPALVLYPKDEALRTGSTCTVSFTDVVVDKDGNRICAAAKDAEGNLPTECPNPGDTSLVSFQTEALRVKGVLPNDGSINVAYDATLLVQYNALMDAETQVNTVVKNVTKDTVVDAADLTFTVSEEQKDLVNINHVSGFSNGDEYQLTVPVETVTDIYGGGLAEAYSITFTVAAFELKSTVPADMATNVAQTADVKLTFSGVVDAASAATVVIADTATSTPVSGLVVTVAENNTKAVTFSHPVDGNGDPTSSWAANTEYSVTVPVTLTNSYGTGLAAETVFTFTTAE